MSNIIILFYAPQEATSIPCYYHQLGQALQKSHSVLLVNNYIPNRPSGYIHDNMVSSILNFNADLIITFNHVINEEVYKKTHCPVIVIESDSVEAFPNRHLIDKYQDRIHLGICHKNRYNIVKNTIPQIKKNKVIVIKNSTILKPEILKQDINISCIGTMIGNGESSLARNLIQNVHNQSYINKFKDVFNKALHNWNDIDASDLKSINSSSINFFHFMSFYTRLTTLDSVASLGLSVYGLFINLDGILSLYDLFFSLKGDKIFSVSENQNLYNRSKLSMNVHFIHNIRQSEYSGYSWRVCDIMATNACLVSAECSALDQDFGKWVKIPQFSNKHEAYDLCKKLLAEENLRKDIVAGSQLAIKEGKFSFYDRVHEIEEFFSLKPSEEKLELRYEHLCHLPGSKKNRNKSSIFRKNYKAIAKNVSRSAILTVYHLNLAAVFKVFKKIKSKLTKSISES